MNHRYYHQYFGFRLRNTLKYGHRRFVVWLKKNERTFHQAFTSIFIQLTNVRCSGNIVRDLFANNNEHQCELCERGRERERKKPIGVVKGLEGEWLEERKFTNNNRKWAPFTSATQTRKEMFPCLNPLCFCPSSSLSSSSCPNWTFFFVKKYIFCCCTATSIIRYVLNIIIIQMMMMMMRNEVTNPPSWLIIV